MSDPGGLSDIPEGRARRRLGPLPMGLAAIAVASLLGGLWVLRPLAGARSWAGRTLCGPVGSGSTGDGVEESAVSDPGAVQGLRLSIVRVGVFGRFTGTLSGG